MHFAILAVSVFCATAAARPTVCLERWTYVEKAQRCYRTVPGRWNWFTWDDAHKICLGWNATLPIVFDGQTDDALRGFASGQIENNPGIFHLGLRYTFKPTAAEGEWFWLDGSKADFTNWEGGRAEIAHGHCAQAALHEYGKGYWWTEGCSSALRPVICEMPPLSAPRAANGDEDATADGNSSGTSKDGSAK